jgi:6-phosphogluconolactonase
LKPNVYISRDVDTLAHDAAARFADRARAAIAARGVFTVALSGGSTPKLMYSLLAEGPNLSHAEWQKIQFFWSDERCVPPDDPDSNYRMADQAMLSRIHPVSGNVHRMYGENPDVAAAAASYAAEIRQVLASDSPRFDMILLGLGPDGHTASLFPGSAALTDEKDLVVANWVEKFKTWRLTMTARLINNAAYVMFQAAGPEKAQPLREVLLGEYRPDVYPAQLIRLTDGECDWLIDQAAASLLPHNDIH